MTASSSFAARACAALLASSGCAPAFDGTWESTSTAVTTGGNPVTVGLTIELANDAWRFFEGCAVPLQVAGSVSQLGSPPHQCVASAAAPLPMWMASPEGGPRAPMTTVQANDRVEISRARFELIAGDRLSHDLEWKIFRANAVGDSYEYTSFTPNPGSGASRVK